MKCPVWRIKGPNFARATFIMSDKEIIGGYTVLSYRTVQFKGTINQKELVQHLSSTTGEDWKPGRKVREKKRLWLYFESEHHLLILIQEKEQLTSVLLERGENENKA